MAASDLRDRQIVSVNRPGPPSRASRDGGSRVARRSLCVCRLYASLGGEFPVHPAYGGRTGSARARPPSRASRGPVRARGASRSVRAEPAGRHEADLRSAIRPAVGRLQHESRALQEFRRSGSNSHVRVLRLFDVEHHEPAQPDGHPLRRPAVRRSLVDDEPGRGARGRTELHSDDRRLGGRPARRVLRAGAGGADLEHPRRPAGRRGLRHVGRLRRIEGLGHRRPEGRFTLHRVRDLFFDARRSLRTSRPFRPRTLSLRP